MTTDNRIFGEAGVPPQDPEHAMTKFRQAQAREKKITPDNAPDIMDGLITPGGTRKWMVERLEAKLGCTIFITITNELAYPWTIYKSFGGDLEVLASGHGDSHFTSRDAVFDWIANEV